MNCENNISETSQMAPQSDCTAIGSNMPLLEGASEKPTDPHYLARKFIQDKYTDGDTQLLRYYENELYVWEKSMWNKIEISDLRPILNFYIKTEFDKQCVRKKRRSSSRVSPSLVTSTLQALQSRSFLHTSKTPPFWISRSLPYNSNELLVFGNGILHFPSLGTQLPSFYNATPNLFNLTCIQTPFEVQAPEPIRWLKFLNQLWPNDVATMNCLQEIFGLLLSPITSFHKIFLFYGVKRGGKSTIATVLAEMLGTHNVAAPTFSGLATQFGMWPLLGKSIAIIPDARLGKHTDSSAVLEKLLSISGEDSIVVDRKNLPPLSTKLNTRFLILTNELFNLTDSSGALASRFVIIPFERSFLGVENHKLLDELLNELPGILLWAIKGLQRLTTRDAFAIPAQSKAIGDELADLSSPISLFVHDACDVAPVHSVMVKELYESYRNWCEEQGRTHPSTLQVFARDLHAAFPQLRVTQKTVGSSRLRFYEGIRVRCTQSHAINSFPENF